MFSKEVSYEVSLLYCPVVLKWLNDNTLSVLEDSLLKSMYIKFLLFNKFSFAFISSKYFESPRITWELDSFRKVIISCTFNSLSIGTTTPVIQAARYDTDHL